MSTHSDTDPSTLAKKWAPEAERQLHELVNDPPSSREGRQVALQHVRALQAQAQIYATLEGRPPGRERGDLDVGSVRSVANYH